MTAVASPVASGAADVPGESIPTPKKLKAYRMTIWVLVGLLFAFCESTLLQSRSAFKTIGKDTVPSILAAQEIGYALADLDANVANSLLGNEAHRRAAAAVVEKQRLKVTDSLVDAAQNITYGNAEKVPIRDMVRDLGRYLELVAEARVRFDANDVTGALTAYWSATDLLHKNLLVEASDLDAANASELAAAYKHGGRETEGAEILIVFLGGTLLVALAALQWFLFRRMRRVLSLPLLAASVLALTFPIYLAFRFLTARESLRVAKEDAFDSIHSLVRARTLAYDANGDESRYLLDQTGKRGFDALFRSKVSSLTTTPTDVPPNAAALNARKQRKQAKTATGLLWDELDNVTFDGELAAATAMVGAFRDYMLIDARIRKLATDRRLADAIELCIGDRPDESNAAFDHFDAALTRTREINREVFDREIDGTNHDLDVAEGVAVVLALLIAWLTWLGVRPRLLEYSA